MNRTLLYYRKLRGLWRSLVRHLGGWLLSLSELIGFPIWVPRSWMLLQCKERTLPTQLPEPELPGTLLEPLPGPSTTALVSAFQEWIRSIPELPAHLSYNASCGCRLVLHLAPSARPRPAYRIEHRCQAHQTLRYTSGPSGIASEWIRCAGTRPSDPLAPLGGTRDPGRSACPVGSPVC